MNEQTKAIIVCITFIVYMANLSLILDYFLKREARRQFYKNLLRLIILYENNPSEVYNREMPKILGTYIRHYCSYNQVMHEILLSYHSAGFQSALAYALSLHQSYCVSTREFKKYKIKLLKEK